MSKMTLGGDMLKSREDEFMERPRDIAERSHFLRMRRRTDNGEVSRETFALPVETARLKVRDIIDRAAQRGYLEIVEGWRQRPDGLIEFAICRLASRTE